MYFEAKLSHAKGIMAGIPALRNSAIKIIRLK
jgi:hypothetical protein